MTIRGNSTGNSEEGGNWFDNVWQDFKKSAEESWKEGSTEIAKPIKELTGAKAAEDANKQARKQFEETKANAERDRQDQIAKLGQLELQKSQAAGAARTSAQSRSSVIGKSEAFGSFSLGEDEKDFLGL
jgi:hypothetical protein